jgi:alpha-beta hydrolase superfamily lysophospholipase
MVLQNTVAEIRGKSLQLIVAVHAWTSSSAELSHLRNAVAKEMPDADLLFPDYPATVFSSEDPIEVTQALIRAISDAANLRKRKGDPYQQIILIGHSLGALLVRKAYAFARGQTQDIRGPLRALPMDWAALITRIILLAGTNRGWSLSKRPRNMSWLKSLGFSAAAVLWRWLRLGRLIHAVRRGTPFVTNLRIQWLRLVQETNIPMPVTIQLLGDVDDVVSEEDNVDVQSGAGFIYRRVPQTGHANVIRFEGPGGDLRLREFLYALKTSPEDLRSDAIVPLNQDNHTQLVVFVMHGIRDYGFWTRKVAQRIEEIATASGAKVRTITSGYGYFPMMGFLLQPERQRNVRWFMDQYTEVLARYPQARIGFIGHSNGSYLLASALQRYAACSFDRVVFAGSVVYRAFPWDELVNANRVAAIRNYVATGDWVVGIFPAIFEYFRNADLGSAGHNGFIDNEGQRHQITFIKGHHSAAIVPDNFDAIGKFVLGEAEAVPPPSLIGDRQLDWVITALLAIAPAAALLVLSATGYWYPHWGLWLVGLMGWPIILYAILRTI